MNKTVVFFTFVILALAVVVRAQTVGGGLSPARPADEHVTKAVQDVRSQVETQTNASYAKFIPISYKTQVVRGFLF
jgi:hypothetical protein